MPILPRMTHRCVVCALWVAAVVSAQAAPWWTLPVDGHLEGDALPLIVPDAPALHWTVTSERRSDQQRHVVAILAGSGTEVRIEADLDLGSHSGTWKLVDGVIDLSEWHGAVARLLPTSAANLVITGSVSAAGSGELRENDVAGTLNLVLRDGTVRDPKAGWRLDGVGIEGRFAVDGATGAARSASPLTLTIKTITTSRFGARNLVVHGMLKDARTFALAAARLEIAGGDMTWAPCLVSLNPFHIFTEVTVNRIGLQDVVALVPNTLAGAHGRVDGIAELGWSSAGGFELGTGHLILRRDDPAQVTLRPFPGLFTGQMNQWVAKYILPGLHKAEMGEVPIEANSLDVTFSPTPDAQGRTAVIHLTGSPKGKQRIPIDLETNVRGPLQTFIDLGTAPNLRVGVGVHP